MASWMEDKRGKSMTKQTMNYTPENLIASLTRNFHISILCKAIEVKGRDSSIAQTMKEKLEVSDEMFEEFCNLDSKSIEKAVLAVRFIIHLAGTLEGMAQEMDKVM